nr:MAG TPA: hypothetical protein [Caudoviricetes sp.]
MPVTAEATIDLPLLTDVFSELSSALVANPETSGICDLSAN